MLHILSENKECFPEKSREQTMFFLSVLWSTESFPSQPYLWWISPPQVFPFPSLCFYNINPPRQYQNINNNPLCIWFNRGFPLGYSMEVLRNFFFLPQIFLRIKAKITYSAGNSNVASHILQLDFFKPRESCTNQGDVPAPPRRGLLILSRLTESVNWATCEWKYNQQQEIALQFSPLSPLPSPRPQNGPISTISGQATAAHLEMLCLVLPHHQSHSREAEEPTQVPQEVFHTTLLPCWARRSPHTSFKH